MIILTKRILFLLFLTMCCPALADELYAPAPHCAVIRNQSDRSMNVTIRTDYYSNDNGSKDRFETVLHLDKDQFQEVCVKGPFYPDYKVYLAVTAMMPLFECQTRLEGEIGLHADRKKDGSYEIHADCKD